MAVKIRLRRMGKKRQPSYRVVVADGRSPRDGRFIEQIGRYDPLQEPSLVEIDNDKAIDWLNKGAQPTAAARKLLEISGAWGTFRASRGDVITVGEVAPPPPKKKKSKKQKAAEAAAAEAGAEAAEAVEAEEAVADDAPAEEPAAEEAAPEASAAEEAAPEEAAADESTDSDESGAEDPAANEAPDESNEEESS